MKPMLFIDDEYYHVFGHAVENRNLTTNIYDGLRFLVSLRDFNTIHPIGSIFEQRFIKDKTIQEKLVDIICYCLNPNHYHLLLRQRVENGVSKMMHRLGTGYTMYYNEKYGRKGPLFRGRFKAVHIEDNDHLLYASAYINLNNRVHRLGGSTSKSVIYSSWGAYVFKNTDDIVSGSDIILDQFNNKKGYKKYAESALELMLQKKDDAEWFKKTDIS